MIPEEKFEGVRSGDWRGRYCDPPRPTQQYIQHNEFNPLLVEI